jgi:hypothetical protein
MFDQNFWNAIASTAEARTTAAVQKTNDIVAEMKRATEAAFAPAVTPTPISVSNRAGADRAGGDAGMQPSASTPVQVVPAPQVVDPTESARIQTAKPVAPEKAAQGAAGATAATSSPTPTPTPAPTPTTPKQEDPALQGVLAEIAKLVQQNAAQASSQVAQQQSFTEAISALNTPKVVGQQTVRRLGGVVETFEKMSDGTTGKLISSDKDYSARDSAMKMFENTGLGQTFITSLMNTIDKVYAENIMPTDAQVTNSIYNSDAYKTRFAANQVIAQRLSSGKGLPGDKLLTPAEYIATENTFRDLMVEAGLPSGFYDTPEDFSKFIENNTSAAEVSARINVAKSALQNADKNIVNALKTYYGFDNNDLAAYLLDPAKAMDIVNANQFKYTSTQAKQMLTAAQVGGAALSAGTTASKGLSEEIATAGKEGQSAQAFQTASQSQKDYSRLLGLSGQVAGSEDLVRQQLDLTGGAEIAKNTKKLASRERARFQQQGALGQKSLSKRTDL